MELSNINVKINTSSCNDSSVKFTLSKDNESKFSVVYKDVSNKTNNENTQDKIETVKKENNLVDDKLSADSEIDNYVDSRVAEKDLNKLINLLLMSGNLNQNLVNLLTSNNVIDKNELKQLLVKMLQDNLSGDFPSKDNALNLNFITKREAPTDDITNKQVSPIDEIAKMILTNKVTLDESIDKLASNIADKLVSDNTIKANVLSNILAKVQEPVINNESSLKTLILNQLKEMVYKNSFTSDVKYTSSLGIDNKPNETDKSNLLADLKTEALNTSAGNANTAVNKTEDSLFNKDDILLRKIVDGDSIKNNKDNVSEKIANVINRFETVRIDNSIPVEGKVTINKATFNQDFIKAVKFMDLNNLKELSVKVLPKDLGEIVIRLSMDNGVMKANIIATNKDTYNLLNSQLPAISNQLAEQNMTIQNFSLSLYNGDNFLFNGDGSSKENTKQQGKNNIKVEAIEDLDLQKEQYFEEHSSVNILA